MSDQKNPPPGPEGHLPDKDPPPVVLTAEELFRGRREVWIEHAGIRYRLRLTRRNKLILKK